MSVRIRVAVTVACAVVAFVAMALYAAGVRSEAAGQREDALERYGGETVQAYVATREIARGETFTERNVATAEWLVDLLPEGALTAGAEVLGKSAVATIAQNTPLSLVDVDGGGSVLDVPPGLVAVSVPCTNEGAVGGALASGSLVDVYVVVDGTARLLSQGVRVLQTNAEGTAANLSWATVAVDPAEVQALVSASAIHKLYFTLPSSEEIENRSSCQAALDGAGAAATDDLPPGAVGGVAAVPDDFGGEESGGEVWVPEEGVAEGAVDAGGEDAGEFVGEGV